MTFHFRALAHGDRGVPYLMVCPLSLCVAQIRAQHWNWVCANIRQQEIMKIIFASRVAPSPRVVALSPAPNRFWTSTMLPSTVTHNKTFMFNLFPPTRYLNFSFFLTITANKAHFKEEQLLFMSSLPRSRRWSMQLNSSGRSKTAKTDVWKVKKKVGDAGAHS